MEFLKTGCDNIEYNLRLLICVTFDKIEGKIKGKDCHTIQKNKRILRKALFHEQRNLSNLHVLPA